MTAASIAVAQNKLPYVDKIKDSFTEGKTEQEAITTVNEFLSIESAIMRDSFTEAFAHHLSHLKGNGDLHNENLHRVLSKVAMEIELRNQCMLAPIKQLMMTLSKVPDC